MNLLSLYLRYAQPLLPILSRWEREGVNVDLGQALLISDVTAQQAEQLEQLLDDVVGDPTFNWRSPKQVAELFYEIWGLPKQYTKHKPPRLTTDKLAKTKLEHWIKAGGPARAEQYQRASLYFTISKALWQATKFGEYVERIDPTRGKLHCIWKAHKGETFRLISVPNLQNWSQKAVAPGIGSPRSMVIPDNPDEDVFISCDWSQIELWIYANIFKIENLLQMYRNGEYVYGIACEEVLGKPFFTPGKPRTKNNRLDTVSEEDILRAKAVPLGFQYARSGESVGQEHGWAAGLGTKYQKKWFGFVPELPRSHATLMYQMEQRRELRPPPGLLLHYPNPSLQGLACMGQTPGAMILYETCILLEDRLRALGHRSVLSVHDAILFNIRGGKKDPKLVKEAYEDHIAPVFSRPIDFLDGFQFRHEAKIGSRWDWDMIEYDKWLTQH